MTDIGFKITGDNTGFLRALDESKAALESGVEEMSGIAEGLTGALERVTGVLGIFTAALAGGAAFKEFVAETVNLTTQSMALGQQLGISATEASVLKVALDDVYVTQEQLSAGANAATRTLREHEDSFKRLGVATRAQGGAYRNTLDIMLDVNEKLAELKEGTDRNVEGQRIYGRSWAEIAPIIRLTREAMEEAQQRAEALGLEIGTKDYEAVQKYRKAMNEANDVTHAAAKAIGDQLLPQLTAMGEEMSEMGSSVVTVFKYIGATVVTLIEIFRNAFVVVFESLHMLVDGLWALFSGFANSVARLLVFDFSGAKAAWKAGWDELGRIGNEAMEKMAESGRKMQDRIVSAFASAAGAPNVDNRPISRPGGGGAGDTDPSKSRFAGWEAELAEEKLKFQEQEREQGRFHEFSKQQELNFWQQKLATVRASHDEEIAIRKQVATVALAIDKEKFDAEIAGLKAQEAHYAQNANARLAIAKQEAAKIKAAYGEESKAYQDAARHVIEIEEQKQAQLRAIRQQAIALDEQRALAGIDAAEETARLETELHRQTEARLLDQEREFEAQRFAIRRQALLQQRDLVDPQRDPVAYARLNGQIEQLEIQHQHKLGQIQLASIKEQQKHWTQLFRTMQSGFERVIYDFLQVSKTLGGTIRGLLQAVGDAILELIARQAAEWLAVQLEQLVFGKTAAASTIATQAAIAGASGVASWAAAPWPIDIGAPAFGAAMAALAGSYGALAAAEGGYDVPAGLSPITQLHPKEMVLPKDLADTVRGMAAGGGGNRGSGGAVKFKQAGRDHVVVTKKDFAKMARQLNNRFAFTR